MISYFSGHSGALSPPCSPWSQQLGEHPSYAPMMLSLHPHSAPWSHDLGRPWLPLTHVLHAHLAAPSASSCFVSCWITRMPWTVIRPSFRSCQVEPMTCTSRCALPNSHLRAGCQFLRCRIPRQPMLLTSFPAWLGHSIVKPMFVNNLRCRFIPLLAWLPATLGTVLDSLPKCAPRACLTLLQSTPTKRTWCPRQTDSKYPRTVFVPRHNPCFSHETSSFAHIQQQFSPSNFVNLFQNQVVTHSVLAR